MGSGPPSARFCGNKNSESAQLWETHNVDVCSLSCFCCAIFFVTFRFVGRTGPQTLLDSCGFSSSPLWSPGVAPPVLACERETMKYLKYLFGRLRCENSLCLFSYVVAECRLDRRMSMVLLEGERSSTGEMKPSTSSSMCPRKLNTLRSGWTVTANWVLESPSSSEPSSSSCRRKES